MEELLPHLAGIFGEQSVPLLELGWLISVITFFPAFVAGVNTYYFTIV